MRIVITGGPSVGKTTVINLLAERGFSVVQEFATQIIKEGKHLPWVDRVRFQSEVLKRQMNAEAGLLEFDKTVFLDRGLFDGEAYYIYDKLPVPPIFSNLDASHYTVAFLMEPLPFFDANDVRRENLEFTLEISRILESCYTSRNVKVIRVPALPPVERVDFVIKQVQDIKRGMVFSPEQAAMMFQTSMTTFVAV